MCGIAGGWFLAENVQLQNKLSTALEAMKLRGPNDIGSLFVETIAGSIALGHTRLSIIDLTSGGHQPMDSACGRYTVVFNGEIYNYIELKSELKDLGVAFSSNSDTEVLLAAWSQWGQKCLTRLVGMFAFVVFDRKDETLTCVRDAFGIKPLFISHESTQFAFASELRALKALKSERCNLNLQRSYDYLMFGLYDSGEHTFIENVQQLLPGNLIVFDVKKNILCSSIRWWNPEISVTDISFKDASEKLREMFLRSVKLHLRSDVPIGAALSGGVDSSSVVCAIRYLDHQIPINTFSYIARGSSLSEEVWVDQVNQYVGANPYKVIVSPEEMIADLEEMIEAQGEPFGSTSIYAQYRVFKEAKNRGVLVTLDGQGADELLAGYIGFPGQRMRSLIDERRYLRAFKFLMSWSKWPGRSIAGGLKRLVGEIYGESSIFPYLRRLNGETLIRPWLDKNVLVQHGVNIGFPSKRQKSAEAKGRWLVTALKNALTYDGLPSLLRHADRNSMRFSVESRVPFLTIEIAEFLLSLPENFLVSDAGETKHVFREAMRGIVPDNILDRKDKLGFETPQSDWLKKILPQLRKWIEHDQKIPFLKHDVILDYFDSAIEKSQLDSSQIWRLVNFYRWHKQFFI